MSRPASGHGTYHDVHLRPDPARATVWRTIAEHLAGWIPQGAAVLEIGAGYCDWVNAVRAPVRVAVDVWPALPNHAGAGVRALVMDVSAGSLRSLGAEQFDVVLASNLLEHFEADTASAVVADVAALLRPRGRFIVIQPNFRYAYRSYFDDYTHRSVFTDVSLAALLASHGFEIELSQPKFLPYSMRHRRWPIAAWAIRAYLGSPIKPWPGQMLVVARKR